MTKRINGLIALFFMVSIPCMGKENPSAEEIRARVAGAYKSLKRYRLTGMAGAVRSSELSESSKTMPFVIAVEFPDKMRIEGNLPDLLSQGFELSIINGKKAWMYNAVSKQYYHAERSGGDRMVSYLDRLLFIRYRGMMKPDGTAILLRTEKLQVKGESVDCYVIQIDRGDLDPGL